MDEVTQHPDAVPNAGEATADEAKFAGYLLNPNHPDGATKARFFAGLGFDRTRADDLRLTFLTQLPQVPGRYSRTNSWGGDHWEAVMQVEATGGNTVEVKTVWCVTKQGTHFITATPHRRRMK